MNDRLLELEMMKIMQEYKLLLLDEEYKNEMISLNKTEFLKEIGKKGGIEEPVVEDSKEKEPNIENNEDEVNDELNDEVEEVDEKTSLLKESIKKLYRKIVKLTHPDKTMHKNNKKELNELYIRAERAMATMDVYEILIICDKLDIEYQIDIIQKDILEENLQKKKSLLKGMESSFIWQWIIADTDEKKDSIVDLFLQTHKKK